MVNGGKGRNTSDKSSSEKDNEESKLKVKMEENVKNIGKITSLVKSDYQGIQIQGKIFGIDAILMLDTGAVVSLISERFIGPDLRTKLTSTDKRIVSATGQAINVEGIVECEIEVNGELFKHNVFVARNLCYDVIIGTDVMKKVGAILDMKDGSVNWNGHYVKFWSDSQDIRCSVHLMEKIEIPARSQVMCVARVSSEFHGKLGIVEPKIEFIEKYNIMPARVLTKASDQMAISVVNSSTKPVILHKKVNIGSFCEVDEIRDSYPVNEILESKERNDPDLLKDLDIDKEGMSKEQNERLTRMFRKYQDVFAKDDNDLGETSLVSHHIDTGDAHPIKQRPYSIPFAQKEEVRKQIKSMLEKEVIRPSSSPWGSPVVLVKKADGSYRFCIDYRKLNAVTRKDVYPLPRIDEMLEVFQKAKYFSVMDVLTGYWNVPVREEDKEKTAFVTSEGLYEFNCLPFGLCNGPGTFQRLMDLVLSGIQWKMALAYIDDIIVFSETFDEHIERIEEVFTRLRGANLKLKKKKCSFFKTEVEFLGHIVTSGGVKADPKKVEAVRKFPRPTSVKFLRAFLGLASYYRKFIPNFAKIADPLNKLLHKETLFAWNEKCEEAFQKLKELMTKAPVLCFPDFEKPFKLCTDASDQGLGVVLSQDTDVGERPIAYASRSLKKSELNYPVIEKEALAVVWGIGIFRQYLLGHKFTVITDHNPLRWLMGIKNPSGRLARWALAIQEYDVEIQYKPGKKHGNADGLSRSGKETQSIMTLEELPEKLQTKNISEMQMKDPKLRDIMNYLKCNELPTDEERAKRVMASVSFYEMVDDVLYHIWAPDAKGKRKEVRRRLVIPRTLIDEVLTWCHDDHTAGHLAFHKTYYKIRERFFWEGMYRDIDFWCKSCVNCASRKTPKGRKRAPMLPIPVDGPFDRVAVDVLGPLPPSLKGNRYIVVFSDYLTRWVEAFAISNADAKTTAKLFVEEIICRHSAPRTLLSDRGRNFTSSLMKEVCEIVNTKKIFTTAYHPQCDGLVEKFNETLATMLSMFVNDHQRDWDVYIPYVLFAYRTSLQETIQETPFYLVYGRDARLPIDVALSEPTRLYTDVDDYKSVIIQRLNEAFTLVKNNIELAQQKQKQHQDKNAREPDFSIGDRVWIYLPVTKPGLTSKLIHPWNGPHRVIEKTSPVNFKVESCDNKKRQQIIHANRMKIFVDPEDLPPNLQYCEDQCADEDNSLDENEVCHQEEGNRTNDEIEEDPVNESNDEIVEVCDKLWSRNKKGRAEAKYFVKYKNDEKESAWVDSSLVPGDLLEEFERNYKGRGAAYRQRRN